MTKQWKRIMAIVLTMVMLVPYMAHAQETNANASASANVIANASSFVDIRGHWAEETIVKWSEQGLVKGQSADRFNPNASITRAELAALINKAAGMNEEAAIAFTDVASGKWYYIEVAKAIGAGYMQGYADGMFKPEAAISRQELAVLIARLLGIEEQEPAATYADVANAPAWSRGAIGAVIEAGIMSGKSDGQFSPLTPTTRAEAVVILDRIVDKLAAPVTPALTVTYDEAGMYGSEKPETIEGAVIISAADVVLRNTTVAGDLTITKAVGEGDVTLNGVTVRGRTLIQGGGANSIHIENSSLGQVEVNKPGGAIRVVFDESSKAERVSLVSPAKIEAADGSEVGEVALGTDLPSGSEIVLEGSFKRIVVGAQQAKLTTDKGTIDELQVSKDAKGSKVELGKDSKVKQLTLDSGAAVSGEGAVEKAAINAEGATLAKKPGEVAVKDGVKASVGGQVVSGGSATTTPPAAGGVGGGASNPGGGNPNPGNPGGGTPDVFPITLEIVQENGQPLMGAYEFSIFNTETEEFMEGKLSEGQYRVSLKAGSYSVWTVYQLNEDDEVTDRKYVNTRFEVSSSGDKRIRLIARNANLRGTVEYPDDLEPSEYYLLEFDNKSEDDSSYLEYVTDSSFATYLKNGAYSVWFYSEKTGGFVYVRDVTVNGQTEMDISIPKVTAGVVTVDSESLPEGQLTFINPAGEYGMTLIKNGQFQARLVEGTYTEAELSYVEADGRLRVVSIGSFEVDERRALAFPVQSYKLKGTLLDEQGLPVNGTLIASSISGSVTMSVVNGKFGSDELTAGYYGVLYKDGKGNQFPLGEILNVTGETQEVQLTKSINVTGSIAKSGVPLDGVQLIIQSDELTTGGLPFPHVVGGVAQVYVENGLFAFYLPQGNYVIHEYNEGLTTVKLTAPIRFSVGDNTPTVLKLEVPLSNVTGTLYDTDGKTALEGWLVVREIDTNKTYSARLNKGEYEFKLDDGTYLFHLSADNRPTLIIKQFTVADGKLQGSWTQWSLPSPVALSFKLDGVAQPEEFKVIIGKAFNNTIWGSELTVRNGQVTVHLEPGDYVLMGYVLQGQEPVRYNIPIQLSSGTTITIPTT